MWHLTEYFYALNVSEKIPYMIFCGKFAAGCAGLQTKCGYIGRQEGQAGLPLVEEDGAVSFYEEMMKAGSQEKE